MEHIKVMLEYFHPWTNSAGFYYARSQGWYEEAGIDVEFVCYDAARGDTLAYLKRGEVDFGIFPTNRLLVMRENSKEVVSIASINHGGMETIQTVKSTGIRRPADLSNKRIALNPTPRGIAMVKHLIAADGGDPNSFTIVDSGVKEYQAEDIIAGKVDATFGSYWAWELQMDSIVPEEERFYWKVDDIGAPPYHSYLLGTNQKLIDKNPQLIYIFLEITARGFIAVANKPSIAEKVYERYVPYFPVSLITKSLSLIAATWLHEGYWGYQRPELMEPYAKWLEKNGILEDCNIWKEACDYRFLPEGGYHIGEL
ncbi:ABC transporter substrate-binding protein [Metabacillus fastidiosus]|uniref:ABC transporter substrate-binding protein n=1 Tax=Metabacillus fastidiosus TaxID=1458 RepID=UPI0008247CAF|nr:ABC transporter substrate-binding protein [Metabacillus fastidiosus]MED4461037.1 ABC transporter substrate-binding protein [Metabacillus fastidiosus]